MPFFALQRGVFASLALTGTGEPKTSDFAKDLIEALTPIGE
jgi:hypothetical protein